MIRLCLCVFLALLPFTSSAAEKLNLNVFQEPSGAITVLYGGNLVDPYFATKALLLAKDGGLDIHDSATAWINWAIKHQNENGLFSRYCRGTPGAEWKICAEADADDALLALWLELLYYMAPDSGIPEEWQQSLERSRDALAEIFNSDKGIYHISLSNPVGLLMDNIEIYAALFSISIDQNRLGMNLSAWFTRAKAYNLLKSIYIVFGDEENRRFRITTQDRDQNLFYPDRVAQLFPNLYNLPDVPEKLKVSIDEWLEGNGQAWLNMKNDVYPWGLIAVTALSEGRPEISACWLAKAESFRYSARWNILEEAAYQHVKERIKQYKLRLPACSGILASG